MDAEHLSFAGDDDAWETLSRARERTASAVEQAEQAWRRGTLAPALAEPALAGALGPLLPAYRNLATPPDAVLAGARGSWAGAILDEFRMALRNPEVWCPARALDLPTGQGLAVQAGMQWHPMRLDQAVQSRAWGIGIDPDDPATRRALAEALFRRALGRLGSSLGLLSRMCAAVNKGRISAQGIHLAAASPGILFEHLVVDILNEEAPLARRACLKEDLFEWTDIRVRYPDLQRKNGARVQVKLTTEPAPEPPAHVRDSSTHVLLAPGPLSLFFEGLLGEGRHVDLTHQFWQDLGAEPADAAELGHALFRLFARAIEGRTAHPLGPMMQVPRPVRELIRVFIREESFLAAGRLVASRALDPRAKPRWSRRI